MSKVPDPTPGDFLITRRIAWLEGQKDKRTRTVGPVLVEEYSHINLIRGEEKSRFHILIQMFDYETGTPSKKKSDERKF